MRKESLSSQKLVTSWNTGCPRKTPPARGSCGRGCSIWSRRAGSALGAIVPLDSLEPRAGYKPAAAGTLQGRPQLLPALGPFLLAIAKAAAIFRHTYERYRLETQSRREFYRS
jgi:hypothetical protein